MIKYENETFLNSEETSKYLGKNLTAFRQFMYRNNLPRRKIGGRLYFKVTDLNGYFANKTAHVHFETSGLRYDDVYTMEQLLKIFLTTKQNVYSFVSRHKIKKYKDNTGKTLYERLPIDAILKGEPTTADDL